MSQPQAPAISPVIVIAGGTPPLILRVLYFVAIGWWLGGIATVFAWLCVLSILLLPVGLMVINRLPGLVTLRSQGRGFHLKDGVLIQGAAQHSFLLRAIYLILIGWWFSAIWLSTAYLLVLTLIGIPLAFWMYGRAGAITTLHRS